MARWIDDELMEAGELYILISRPELKLDVWLSFDNKEVILDYDVCSLLFLKR